MEIEAWNYDKAIAFALHLDVINSVGLDESCIR